MAQHPLTRFGKVLSLSLLGGLLAGIIAGVAGAVSDSGGPVLIVIVALAMAGGMGLGLWATLRWWQELDEAAQEAHKSAWFWGSTYGLALGTVVLLTALYGGSGDPFATLTAKDAFMAGIATVAVVQTLGYGIAWAVWWLRRR